VHLVDFIIRIYPVARSPERQKSAPFVNFSVRIGCTVRILFFMVLFVITAQEIFETATADVIVGTAVTLWVLADSVKDSWSVTV